MHKFTPKVLNLYKIGFKSLKLKLTKDSQCLVTRLLSQVAFCKPTKIKVDKQRVKAQMNTHTHTKHDIDKLIITLSG